MDAEAGEAGMQQPGVAFPMPFDRSSSRLGAPGAESFDGALRELKDLRSQLHEAADCCEKAFLYTDKKKLILEGTKGYICDAVVAVIDHLGTVSSKLEHKLQEKTDVTQTERKINFLNQRLLTCEQYAISLKLLTVRGDPDAIQYHRRYISQSTQRSKLGNGVGSSKNDARLPEITGPTVSGATFTLKPYDVQPATGKEHTVVSANFEDSPRTIRRSFSFRAEDVHIVLGDQKKKANHGSTSTILSFLKKTRR
ncbi:probable protein ABIL5 [Miscanthus floridulus]|uniref:probable protein ABIL5 n=1 Tax=Miscanthus floridulus TaxID=154761 RepID=UPI00345A2781